MKLTKEIFMVRCTVILLFAAVFCSAAPIDITPQPVNNNPYWIVMKDARVPSGGVLSFDFQTIESTMVVSQMLLIIDMRPMPFITFDESNVGLADNEAGESFDLYIHMDPNNLTMNLFYINRTTGRGPEGNFDFAIFNHSTKFSGIRGSILPSVISMPTQVVSSGSGNIGSIKSCRKPVVILGDSQSINHVSRIGGQLPSAFTQDRVGINAAISGNRISQTAVGAHTRGDKRYCSDTPGLGDICDMRDIILAITNYAANDIPNGQTVNQIVAAHEAVILDAIANGNEVILMGITPLADFHVSVGDNPTRILINDGLQGLADANNIAWFNPYDAVLANQATYLNTGGLHLTLAGSQFVTSQLVSVYEQFCLCLGDINMDGVRDGLDIQLFVDCLTSSSNCGCVDIGNLSLIVDALMNNPICN